MGPVKNGRLLFNEIPTGYPEPGKTTVYDESQTIDLENVPLNGGFLVKILYLSIDPYLRFRMRDPSIEQFAPAFKLGEPTGSSGLGKVLRSENPSYNAGDRVYGMFPHQQYFVAPKDAQYKVIKNEEKIPWSVYIGVAGSPGMTAYGGWKAFARPKEGDTIFVSTAAGSVGATVVQLAKADGLRVIASTGSPSKAEFVKSIGADVVFNYKEQDIREVLRKEGPLNLYWDHVGGDTTDAFLENAANGAHIIVCGSIASYNGTPSPMYQHRLIFERDITINGFLLGNVMSRPGYTDAFYKDIPKLIASGKMKYREHITKGLANAGHAMLDVQLGRNEGKSVVMVADDDQE